MEIVLSGGWSVPDTLDLGSGHLAREGPAATTSFLKIRVKPRRCAIIAAAKARAITVMRS